MERIYLQFQSWFESCFPSLYKIISPYDTHLRFLIAGCTGAAVNLGLLYVLTDIVGLWYLLSSVLAFIVSFLVSFRLQKYWAFKEPSTHAISSQMLWYLVVALVNLGLNTLILFTCVEILHMHYMLGQVVAGAMVAVWNFFIYKYFIFNIKG